MLDKETLLEMIKEQEQVIEKAKQQLKKLYELAAQNNIHINNAFPTQQDDMKNEIENKRKEIFEKAEKMRQDIMNQVQQTISQAQQSQASMPNMGGIPGMPMGGMPGMPMGGIPNMNHFYNNMKGKTNE